METNITEVSFSNSYTEHLYGFTQYDRGQKLKITGIHTDANTEVHFSLSASGGESPRVLPDSTGAETIVSVPAFVFCADRLGDYEAYAFVCYSDVNVGKTERRIIMHIKSRPKPADFAPPSEPDLTQKVLQELSTKLTAPSSAQVGQIFRVQSINEDGNLVLEAVDMPSGGSGGAVDDVQINGESIVSDGVAEIPFAANNQAYGLVRLNGYIYSGLEIATVAGINNVLRVVPAVNSYISNRNTFSPCPITISNIDYAVKAAMCDGKGAEWTADEQAMARARMGCKSIGRWRKIKTIVVPSDLSSDDSDVIWTADSEGNVNGIYFNTDDDGNTFSLTDGKIHIVVYKDGSESTITSGNSKILIGVNATNSENFGFIFLPYTNETNITLWDVDWVCDSTWEKGKPSSVCSARYSNNKAIFVSNIGYYSQYAYKFFGNAMILNKNNREDFSKIESIKIKTGDNTIFFNTGVTVDVWWEEY